jgi:hypothetical protein
LEKIPGAVLVAAPAAATEMPFPWPGSNQAREPSYSAAVTTRPFPFSSFGPVPFGCSSSAGMP